MIDDEDPDAPPVPQPKKRKVCYQPEFIEVARKMAEEGALDEEIAAALGCSHATFYRWCLRYPEFKAVLKVGKIGPNEQVKRSIYMRAKGYYYRACKIFYNQKTGEVKKVHYKEHQPADPTAQIWWSKNRMPEEFRDVKGVEHSGVVRTVHSIEEMTDEQLARELDRTNRALEAATGNPATADPAPGGKDDPPSVH